MKYKQKSKTIEAWEYNHSLDISNFGGRLRHCVGTHGHFLTSDGELEIKEGDYIVLDEHGWSIWIAENFHAYFEILN